MFGEFDWNGDGDTDLNDDAFYNNVIDNEDCVEDDSDTSIFNDNLDF